MMKLSRETFNQIRQWVHLYGSHLDVMRWRYHYENGTADDVLDALSFYQNDDGGFGHGIGDFDNMSPLSSPTAICWGAYGILREIGCNKTDHPMIKGILRYFENCSAVTEKGVNFALPSNSQYPCRFWYLYSVQPRFTGDMLSPNSCISGDFVEIVFNHCEKGSSLYEKACKIIDYRLSNIQNLAGYLAWDTSQWQGIEPSDMLKLIEFSEKFGYKTHEECSAFFDELLDVLKKNGQPNTIQAIEKRIKNRSNKFLPDNDDLDEIVTRFNTGKPCSQWLKDGLICDNPDERMNELCRLDNLWWPIKDAIDNMKILREHGRLE